MQNSAQSCCNGYICSHLHYITSWIVKSHLSSDYLAVESVEVLSEGMPSLLGFSTDLQAQGQDGGANRRGQKNLVFTGGKET